MKPYVCLLIGLTYATSHAQTRFALARYQMNGTLDGTFGAGGKVGTKFQDPVTQADIPAKLNDLMLVPSRCGSDPVIPPGWPSKPMIAQAHLPATATRRARSVIPMLLIVRARLPAKNLLHWIFGDGNQ
jgi:hypothetical protein